MATHVKRIPEVDENWQYCETFKEGSSQAWKAGDHLIISSGYAVRAADPAANYAPTTQTYLGIALKDATGTQGSKVPMLRPNSSMAQFKVPKAHGSDATTAIADVGVSCVLTHVSAAEGWAALISTTSNPAVQVNSIALDYPVGESKGFLWVSPLASKMVGA